MQCNSTENCCMLVCIKVTSMDIRNYFKMKSSELSETNETPPSASVIPLRDLSSGSNKFILTNDVNLIKDALNLIK